MKRKNNLILQLTLLSLVLNTLSLFFMCKKDRQMRQFFDAEEIAFVDQKKEDIQPFRHKNLEDIYSVICV